MAEESKARKDKECLVFDLLLCLESIKLNYFSLALVCLIIIISVFGRIKSQYRWFILNLAIIDLLLIYDSICTKTFTNCYFNDDIKYFINFDHLLLKFPCIGLFILTGSRFFAIFYSRWYKRLEKTWKSILAILIINLIFLVPYCLELYTYSRLSVLRGEKCSPLMFQKKLISGNISCDEKSLADLTSVCANLRYENYNNCIENYNLSWPWFLIIDKIQQGTPVVALLFSVIFVTFMVSKIVKQVKFQKSSNKDALKTNIRVVGVLMTQTLIFLFILLLDVLFELDRTYINFIRSSNLPCWIYWLSDKDTTIKSFFEIRIFIDSVVVLGFMSGYREDIFAFLKWINQNIKKPLKYQSTKTTQSRIFVTLL